MVWYGIFPASPDFIFLLWIPKSSNQFILVLVTLLLWGSSMTPAAYKRSLLGSQSQKVQVHNGGERRSWQQTAGRAVRAESWALTSWAAGRKWRKAFASKPSPNNVLPPARLHYLNLPRQHHHLRTKCPNARDYGWRFLCKLIEYPWL